MSNTIIEKNGNFACGIFADPQRSFDTMDHIMIHGRLYPWSYRRSYPSSYMLNELCRYGIGGFANKWFELNSADRKQFVSINGFALSISSITYGVPQESV